MSVSVLIFQDLRIFQFVYAQFKVVNCLNMNIFNISTYCHIGIVEAGIGLTNVANGEMIRFGISEEGLVLYFLEKNKISDENIHKKPGQFVIRTFQGPIYTNTESRARTSVVDTDSKT